MCLYCGMITTVSSLLLSPFMCCCALGSVVSDSLDYCWQASSVHGIFQAKVLAWIAISFSRGSSRPRNGGCVSCVSCIVFTCWAIRKSPHRERFFFFLVMNFKIYSFSNFHIRSAVLLTVVAKLYIISPWLVLHYNWKFLLFFLTPSACSTSPPAMFSLLFVSHLFTDLTEVTVKLKTTFIEV